MSYLNKLKDSTAIIFDEFQNCISKTIIADFDRDDMSVFVQDTMAHVRHGAPLSLLIIHSGGVSEFNGIARGLYNGFREISIFKERSREARVSARHVVNMPAVVKGTIVNSVQKPFDIPLDVTVENISTTGALIKCKPGLLKVPSTLIVEMSIGGKLTSLTATVMREQLNDNKTSSYGCKFIKRNA